MKLCKRLLTSLVSRPSHRPVFDHLQMVTNWTVGRPGNEANFLPHLATFVSSGSLLIDSECGKKPYIALFMQSVECAPITLQSSVMSC